MDYPDYIIFRIILYYVLSDPGHLFQFTVCQFTTWPSESSTLHKRNRSSAIELPSNAAASGA